MIVVFIIVTAIAVVAIGLVAIGRVTNMLVVEPPTSVFDLDEAVVWVAEHLPDYVTAQLSYSDVRTLLGFHLDCLESKGVAGENDHDLEALPSGPIVTSEDEGVAYVLGKADEAGLDCEDVHVVEVIEAELAYLTAIGAIGAEVPSPRDPETDRETDSDSAFEPGG